MRFRAESASVLDKGLVVRSMAEVQCDAAGSVCAAQILAASLASEGDAECIRSPCLH